MTNGHQWRYDVRIKKGPNNFILYKYSRPTLTAQIWHLPYLFRVVLISIADSFYKFFKKKKKNPAIIFIQKRLSVKGWKLSALRNIWKGQNNLVSVVWRQGVWNAINNVAKRWFLYCVTLNGGAGDRTRPFVPRKH